MFSNIHIIFQLINIILVSYFTVVHIIYIPSTFEILTAQLADTQMKMLHEC